MSIDKAKEEAGKIDDGGPAFPQSVVIGAAKHGEYVEIRSPPGMSLRDWFAGQAISELVVDHIKRAERRSTDPNERTGLDDNCWNDGDSTFADALASEAYIVADAMLKARKSGVSQ